MLRHRDPSTPSPHSDVLDRSGLEYLRTDGSNLRARTRRAAIFGTAAQFASAAIGLLSVALLSRTLSPDDVGIFAIAAAFLMVLSALSDSGFAYAAEQRDQVSHAQVSNLFWANLLLGLAAFAAACGLAPLIARLYGRSELRDITLALGLALLISSLSLQHAALLRRQLYFGRLAVIQVGSRLVGVGVALIVAMRGGGYLALVAQELSVAIAKALGAWLLCSWRPAPPQRGVGAMPLVRMGFGRSLAEVLGVIRRQVDVFLVGWFLGPEALGLYNRSLGLFAQPLTTAIGPLTRVALPALSRVQSDPVRFRAAMTEGVGALACVTVPLCGFVAVGSDGLVAAVLGPTWQGVSPIMRSMVLGMTVTCLFWPALAWGFSARGLTSLQARWAAAALVTAAAFSAAGSMFGPAGAGWGMSLAACITLPTGSLWALRGSGVLLRDLVSVMFMPILGSVSASAVTSVVLVYASPAHATTSTLLALATYLVVYGAAFVCSARGRSQLSHVGAVVLGRAGQISS